MTVENKTMNIINKLLRRVWKNLEKYTNWLTFPQNVGAALTHA